MNGRVSESTSFGPFTLFPTARVLEKDGTQVVLGSRSLDILILLVERAGEVVSQRELIAHAWRGLVVEPGNLRVHMTGLRKALGDDSRPSRYIANIPGQGYCFVAPIKRESREPVVEPRDTSVTRRRFALPAILQRMVGRDDVVHTVAADLMQNRFITIIGPGGMGKTTVAVSVAHAVAHSFSDNVYFIDLGAIADAQLVTTTVASTLGLSSHGPDVLPTLLSFIQTSRLLLILDNCEHVIDTAASLAETIFKEAPETHILATSREALRVEGEHAYWLPPLDSPPPESNISAERALTFPAVKLFVERAMAGDNRFELTESNATIVADICGRLDGIALALELVAGRVHTYGLEGAAELLNRRLNLNWTGRRTALPRHQTLFALLDWSYGLLPEFEQRLLRTLSIFVGPFSLEAAQALETKFDEAHVADAIDSLIAKSLVSTGPTYRGAARYRLLETTRAYALKRLDESGEARTTAELHARYLVSLLSSAGDGRDRDQSGHENLGNLRAALEWCFLHAPDLGIELAAAGAALFLELSLWNECRKWSAAGLTALTDSTRDAARELVLQEALAVSSMFIGAEDVRATITRALEIARQLGETTVRLRLLASLHFWLTRMTDFAGALAVAEEIDAIGQTTNDPYTKVVAAWLRGSSEMCLGHQSAAMRLFEGGFADGADRHVGNAQQLGIYYRSRALVGLARTRWLCGYPDLALRAAKQSVAEAAGTGLVNRSYTLLIGCHVFLWCGDLDSAEAIVERVLTQPHWEGRLVWFHSEALALKGELLYRRGKLEQGVELLRVALGELKAKATKNLMFTVTASCLAENLSATGQQQEALAVIDDAIASAPGGPETWEAPELLRVKANVLLAAPAPDEAEAERCLERSLALARRQSAKGWELRTATALARLQARRGRTEEAHRVLAPVYDTFTEGFDTVDVKTAKQLIDELRSRGTLASTSQRNG